MDSGIDSTVAAGVGTAESGGSRLWSGLRRAACALLDQGLFAGTTFAMNLLLARWLPMDQYGLYALAWSAFLLLAALHTAAFSEPLLVFGGGRWAGGMRGYLDLLVAAHWRWLPIATVLAGVAAIACVLLGQDRAAVLALGLALMLPCILFLWLMRSACYAAGQGQRVVAGSATWLVLGLGGLCALRASGRLDAFSALAAAAGAALAAGLALRAVLRPRLAAGPAPSADEVLATHRGYARWAAGTSLTGWACANLHYVVLGTVAGLGAVAGMKALDNTLTPVQQCLTAFSQLMLPSLAGSARRDPAGVERRAWALAALFALPALAACLLLLAWPGAVLSRLYGAGFATHAPALAIYALMLVPYAASTALLLACRSLARSDLVFWFHLAFALALAGAYAIGGRHGLAGIAWAAVAVQAAGLPLLAWMLHRAGGAGRRPALTTMAAA